MGLPGQKARAQPRVEDVTPKRTAGTPREWLLLALVEGRLKHGNAATAWRNKAVRWLDRAKADPAVLGTKSNPADRLFFRVKQWRPLSLRSRYEYHTLKRFAPTWRQRLELEVLRNEADRKQHPAPSAN
jgi:hypothetical protein